MQVYNISEGGVVVCGVSIPPDQNRLVRDYDDSDPRVIRMLDEGKIAVECGLASGPEEEISRFSLWGGSDD